jgi:hypothetical protein
MGGHAVVAKRLALFGTDRQQRNVIAAPLVCGGL